MITTFNFIRLSYLAPALLPSIGVFVPIIRSQAGITGVSILLCHPLKLTQF